MKIKWLGHSSFLITSISGESVLTDPYDSYVGRPFPYVKTDIVVISHNHMDHSAINNVAIYKKVVDSATDFSYNNIKIKTFYRNHDDKGGTLRGKTLITNFLIDGLRLCHMGDIGEICSDELIEKMGYVDILFIPIGGTYTIDSANAKKYIEKIQPKIVIPMHFKNKCCVFAIDNVEKFTKLFDVATVKNISDTEIVITKEMLDGEKFNIILMQIA